MQSLLWTIIAKRPPGILFPWTNGQQGGRHWPGVGNRGSAIRVAGSFSLRPGQLDVPRIASSLLDLDGTRPRYTLNTMAR